MGQVAISGISTIDLKSGKALSCTFNISCKAGLAISGIKQGQAEVTETTIPELKISGGKYALSTVGVISYGRIIIKAKISKTGETHYGEATLSADSALQIAGSRQRTGAQAISATTAFGAQATRERQGSAHARQLRALI